MAELADGNYYVYNGAGGNLVLDVAHGNRNNGANVRVWTRDSTDNQVWQVTTRTDGSRQVTSRFTGKSIDVAGSSVTTVGANVQMWTDNDGRAQSWDITDVSATITIGGTSYPLYKVTLTEAPTMCMELVGNSGFTDGTNACIAGYTGGSDQRWAFVPVPKLESGGVYELVLRLDTRYALDVHSGSMSNGANVVLTGRHGANDHKWIMTERTTDHWILRNVGSGKDAEVKNGTAAALTNVQQWVQSGTQREEWKPVSFGTQTLNGVSCALVKLYSWVDGAADTFVMDANQHATLDLGNICITNTDGDDEGQYSQQWLLYPTTATDHNMAIPVVLGWSKSVGSDDWAMVQASAERLYPIWRCGPAWGLTGPNHYEWRWCKRNLLASTSTTTEWSEWTAWETANVTCDGLYSWVTEGLPATYDSSTYKNVEYQIQVRTVGVYESSKWVGLETSEVVTAIKEPSVTLSDAGFSPDGLRLEYASDYAAGTNTIIFTSVVVDGVNILPKRVTVGQLDSSTSVLIPLTSLSGWIDDGDVVKVTWRNGNDQLADFGKKHTATLTASWDTGTVQLTPVVTVGEGRTLTVSVVPQGTHESVYMRVDDGTMERVGGDADHVYSVEYPFGRGMDLWITTASADEDDWAIWHQRYESGVIGGSRPAHAWNWDDGSFVLELRDGEPLQTDFSVETEHEKLSLDSRPWQAVTFGPTASGTITAEGAIGEVLDTEGTRAALEAMRLKGHVRYRSPHGLCCDVAVTDYTLTCVRGIWTVRVSMVRETV